jgi:hypothetical protein
MNSSATKVRRVIWRIGKNALCVVPASRQLLFPADRLACRFGPDDAGYAWSVFLTHADRLRAAGYTGARSLLEAGPGRNIGTALLWWTGETIRSGRASVVLWDVFANASVTPAAWQECARRLLETQPADSAVPAGTGELLAAVADGTAQPRIDYLVCSHEELARRSALEPFGLIYSHAALEHAWSIGATWRSLAAVSASAGWLSIQIDLADHTFRDTNYIDMLAYPEPLYWLMTRFIPGGTNRWRAGDHLAAVQRLGFRVVAEHRALRSALPVHKERLSGRFRALDDRELQTEAVHLIARRGDREGAQTLTDSTAGAGMKAGRP